MSSELVALNNNWLDYAGNSIAPTVAAGAAASSSTLYVSGNGGTATWVYPYNGWYYSCPDRRPIRLTMKEVERLRAAAKRDAKLKAVLAKFTDQIEVVVDFGE